MSTRKKGASARDERPPDEVAEAAKLAGALGHWPTAQELELADELLEESLEPEPEPEPDPPARASSSKGGG